MLNPIYGKPWYKRRPRLKISILKTILMNGSLSKSGVEGKLAANYPDVSDAMDDLIRKKLIIFFGEEERKSGRPERYYRITELGIRAALAEELNPYEFWTAIISLCNSEKQISQGEFDEFYRSFEYKHIGHTIRHGFYSHLIFFDKMLDIWFKEIREFNDNRPAEIPTSQRVVEW